MFKNTAKYSGDNRIHHDHKINIRKKNRVQLCNHQNVVNKKPFETQHNEVDHFMNIKNSQYGFCQLYYNIENRFHFKGMITSGLISIWKGFQKSF